MKKKGLKRGLTARLLVYVRPYRAFVIGAAVCSLFYVAFVLLGPVLYGWAIDAMIGAGEVDFGKVFPCRRDSRSASCSRLSRRNC